MAFKLKSALAPEMYEYLELLTGADKDTESYIGTFKSLDSYLTSVDIREKSLPENLLQDWLKTFTSSSRNKNGYIARVRKFSRYLTALNIPASEPDFVHASTTYLPYTFTDDEFTEIIAATDDFKANAFVSETSYKFAVMFRVLYACGLRVGEALALQWEDINLDDGLITIKKAKNNKQRRIPIKDSLTEILRLYRRRRFPYCDETEFLFGNADNDGKPYLQATFRDWFVRILRQAKISNERTKHFERCISPHTLRHYFTFKSFLNAEAGGRALEEIAPYLSAYLGHESFSGTEKYLSTDYTVYTDSQERVAHAIGDLFPEVRFE
jgi:integrase